MIHPDCSHVCTSDCRRVGCNCECGEWHDHYEPEPMTIEQKIEEGWHDVWYNDQEESINAFRSFALSLRQEVIGEAIGVLPKEADHARDGKNDTHGKDEYWGCCECYEDRHFNACRSQTLSALEELLKK